MSEYNFEELDKFVDEQNASPNMDSVPQQDGNLVLAIIGGVLSSVLIACLWAAISVSTEKQWVFMGILAGLAVGYIVHLMARGQSLAISIVGGFFALLSCVLGDYFTNVGFIAQEEGFEYFQTLMMIDNTYFFEIAFADFGFFSLIVYGIAAYEGFIICNNSDL